MMSIIYKLKTQIKEYKEDKENYTINCSNSLFLRTSRRLLIFLGIVLLATIVLILT